MHEQAMIRPRGIFIPFESKNLKVDLISTTIPPAITDIFFRDSSTGFAVNVDGQIHKTIDGGITWLMVHNVSGLQPYQQFSKVLFTDSNTGYAVGHGNNCDLTNCPAEGVIYRTTDGGNTWDLVHRLPRSWFVSISSSTSGELFAISDSFRGYISKSMDGVNWRLVDSVDFQLGSITFNGSFGFCSGMGGQIVQSTDNGRSWHVVNSLNDPFLNDIKFSSGNGFCSSSRGIYKTEDNGVTWTQVFGGNMSTDIVLPLSENSCLAFGTGESYSAGPRALMYGAILQSINSGNDWVKYTLSNISTIQAASFYSSTEGFAIARRSLIKIKVK